MYIIDPTTKQYNKTTNTMRVQSTMYSSCCVFALYFVDLIMVLKNIKYNGRHCEGLAGDFLFILMLLANTYYSTDDVNL